MYLYPATTSSSETSGVCFAAPLAWMTHISCMLFVQLKCDAWREEVEKLSPLRDEVAQLHQENARLQQELTQVSEDNMGLSRQLQEMSSSMKMVITMFFSMHVYLQ